MLWAASVADQWIVVTPTGKVAGASLVRSTTPTTSVAVAVPWGTTVCGPVASRVASAGGVTTGAVVSRTVTRLVAVPMLWAASVAVQWIVVTPTGKVAGASLVIATTPTASVAVALPWGTDVCGPVASTSSSA